MTTSNTFNANTTFVNVSSNTTQAEDFLSAARNHFAGVEANLQFWMENGTSQEGSELEDYEDMTRRQLIEEFGDREKVRDVESKLETFAEIGDFHEYGLSFDFVEACEDHDAYYRFQICWGGPSSEIRFHYNDTIEAVYMDWFVGVGFDVDHWDAFEWLQQWFKDCEMINFTDKAPEELSSEYHTLSDLDDEE